MLRRSVNSIPRPLRDGPFILFALLFAVALGVTIWVSSQRDDLSGLESTLFSVITLGIGLLGSYRFGQISAANRLYARSALRSVLVLRKGIGRLHDAVALLRTTDNDEQIHLLQLYILNQMDVADAAVNDWSDVIRSDSTDVASEVDQMEESGE